MRFIKAAIYARCSTDEKRQDVDVQFEALRKYCKAYEWEFEEFWEYDSGYKGEQEELKKLLERIKAHEFQVLIVHSLDRFSRQHPSKTERLLDLITQQFKCRFISMQENLDSDNEMIWYTLKGLWAYFANMYSKKLSTKIRSTVRKDEGVTKSYRGRKWGRPGVDLPVSEIVRLKNEGWSYRQLGEKFGVSHSKIMSVIKSFRDSGAEIGENELIKGNKDDGN